MNKKSGWKVVADNAAMPMTEEEYRRYRQKMFKWGMWVHKMPISKPKFNKPKEKE